MARPLLELGTYLCYVFISRCANYIPSKWCWWCFPLLLTNYLHFERSCVFRCQQKSTDVYCRHTTNGAPPNTHKDPFTMVKTMQAKPSIKRTSKNLLMRAPQRPKRQKSTTHLVTIHIFQLEHFCTIMRHAREKESGLIRFSWGEMLLWDCWLNDFHIVRDSNCRCTILQEGCKKIN